MRTRAELAADHPDRVRQSRKAFQQHLGLLGFRVRAYRAEGLAQELPRLPLGQPGDLQPGHPRQLVQPADTRENHRRAGRGEIAHGRRVLHVVDHDQEPLAARLLPPQRGSVADGVLHADRAQQLVGDVPAPDEDLPVREASFDEVADPGGQRGLAAAPHTGDAHGARQRPESLRDLLGAAGEVDQIRHQLLRPARQGEVAVEDLRVDLAQLRPWFEAELLDEECAHLVEVVKCFALPALQVERAHQEGARSFPEREGGDVLLQLQHVELAFEAVLPRLEPVVAEPHPLRIEVGTPEALQGLAAAVVDDLRADRVPAVSGLQVQLRKRLADLVHVRPQRHHRARRRVVPDHADQLVVAQPDAVVQQQRRQHRPLLARPQFDLLFVAPGSYRTHQ